MTTEAERANITINFEGEPMGSRADIGRAVIEAINDAERQSRAQIRPSFAYDPPPPPTALQRYVARLRRMLGL